MASTTVKRTIEVECPFCLKQTSRRFSDDYQPAILWKCKNCGFIWKKSVINDRQYTNNDELYYDIHNLEEIDLRRLDFINRNIKNFNIESINVLDFGGGDGNFLSKLPHTWNKYLVELSAVGRRRAEERHGILTFKQIEDISRGIKFDLILMYDVLEHLEKFWCVIKSIKERLSDDGYIIVETGVTDAIFLRILGNRWKYYNEPEHISFFSMALINKLFNRIGMVCVVAKIVSHHGQISMFRIIYLFFRIIIARLLNYFGLMFDKNLVFPLYKDHLQVIFKAADKSETWRSCENESAN